MDSFTLYVLLMLYVIFDGLQMFRISKELDYLRGYCTGLKDRIETLESEVEILRDDEGWDDFGLKDSDTETSL